LELGLHGKIALISGSTAGIGLAIAAALAKEGAAVFVNGRTPGRVDQAVARLNAGQPAIEARGVAADLSTTQGVAQLASRLPAVDILVNNLGIFEPKNFEDISDADWLRLFETNVLSGVRLSRLYLPQMKRKNWGRIIYISSESALQIPVEMVHYGMTKTAQLAVARGLAETLTGTGITVNSVLPGPTRSEGVEQFVQDYARHSGVDAQEAERQFFKTARPSSIIQRFETVEEIAAMVTFVASEKASAVTGASLRVDGGVVRSIA
jgi:NAD(P)-dependent dehydrogenase (short-subunit alcohol dehydrogenase family)